MIALIACGGTGGHIFPAISIAQELNALFGVHFFVVGRTVGMERELLSNEYEFYGVDAVPLRRGKIIENLKIPFKLFISINQALKVIKQKKPDVVIATGGYVSLPTILAARLKRIPVYLQEQNAVAGVANRIGEKFAKVVFVTSDDAKKFFKSAQVENLGNPIRSIASVNPEMIDEKIPLDHKVILVLGGSQGAVGINAKVEHILPYIKEHSNWHIIWQAGAKNVEQLGQNLGSHPRVHLKGFVNNIYNYMARANVIISRSGASTLAEILAFGKPSILVPYPHATANHQEFNARVVQSAGASLVELESEPNDMQNKLDQILNNTDNNEKMKLAALQLGVVDAGKKIATRIWELENKE
jgi:UDP-N-acetylglucosamine--N-acetylmuramyl-(pentapeptide) pyrophosphoryl-undecaprenol N-acetylglucosamine transferase